MLPVKVYTGRSNSGSAFGELFGDKGLDLAIDLLSDALKTEKDADVRTEIEKRLKLIDPKQANLIKCSKCMKVFQPRKIRKYKQYLCDDCVKARYHPNTHDK
jgi:hypothetical protein